MSADRREVAEKLRLYAGIDFSESDPWWYVQKAMYLPKDAGPGKAIPFREAREALRDLADLIDPTSCGMEDAGDVPESVKRNLSTWFCHECGSPIYNDMRPSYCIYCGARAGLVS